MASEAKPFASLSSGLLARKGAARPAMRPQGFGQVGNGLEDLGWNDMGFEPPKPADSPRDEAHDAFGEDVVEHPRAHHPTGLTPVQSPVHGQQAEIADRFNGADEAEDEEFDETAEVYESEAEGAGEALKAEEAEEALPEVLEVEEAPEAFEAPQLEEAREKAPVVVQSVIVPKPSRFRAPPVRAAVGSKGKAAFTLRLDPERHLKLRLACAVDGRSAQQLVTDALDQLLERMPDLDGLAVKAKRRG